ncbi:hypothetical protein [Flavobacterium sp. LHD-85]|uniref:hypothetical protein n=1 Tax=Flavobacterium sp. LHD-85 TaxID=3071410 RepID=UPI0027DEC11A|nr:hypothetical protein [Flavobacterium sp. LHD-85]MDQ6531272.1 hypothetical protein [Flavobacterium sp. LHD-85]
MPIEPFDFTYTLTSQSEENEVLNTLGKGRIKEFEPKSYFFTESTITAQSIAEGAYGPDFVDTNTKFNITTQFELTNKKAYAVTSGQVLIVPQSGDGNESKVNVFIKPLKNVDVGVQIKYYVYRGLKKELFINSSNNILPKSSDNTPFMAKVWTDLITFNKLTEQPLPEIPASLFGYTTTETGTNSLDAKFFNTYDVTSTDENKAYNLPIIEAGQYFGEFQDNKGGFEIVLNDGFYYQEKSDTGFQFDLNYAKAEKAVLDLADIANNPNISEKIYRENVQKFLDPAAFYGAHITEKEKGEIKIVDNNAKYNTKTDIYNNIISKFINKNKCYIYLKDNRGRSFNFDETLGADPLKIGTSETLTASPYKTNDWPIIISEFEQTHTEEENSKRKSVNDLAFQLKFKTINKNATLYNAHGNCANEKIEGNFLINTALYDENNIATQDYTNKVNYSLINNYNLNGGSLITKSITTFIYINYDEKEVEYFNNFFGPINIQPIIRSHYPISNSIIQKADNKNLKLKFRDGYASIYTQGIVTVGNYTIIPPTLPDDNRTRLYVLKKLDSTENENRNFKQYLSSDSGYGFASNKSEYSAYIYGDKSYEIWKGKIIDGTDTIDTLQLINFEEDTNPTNFMQLGLTEVDFNKLIYNSEEIENSNHIPVDATNLFFHLDDSGITQNSVFKKYKLGIKYQVSNLIGYIESVKYPTINDVFIYTIDGYYFFTKNFSEKFEFAEEFENATINFRTKSNYDGEFGFDWLRIGDTSEPSYETSIVSGYEERNWTGFDFDTEFDTPTEAFQALKKEYIAIKTQKPDELYYVPYLNIYPQNAIGTPLPPSTINLRGLVNISKNLQQISFKYDSSLFSIASTPDPTIMPLTSGPVYDVDILITCLKEFDKDKVIKVVATNTSVNEKEKVIGIIKVCKNSRQSNRQNLKIVLVKATTNIANIPGASITGSYTADEKRYLSNGLYQSFVYGDIEEVILPLDNDPKFITGGTYINNNGIKWDEDGIHQYLRDSLLNSSFGSKFKNYFMCFSFDVNSAPNSSGSSVNGHAQDIGKQVVIVYKSKGKTTVPHEILHGLGLNHTHREEDSSGQPTSSVTSPNAKFVYRHADHLLNLTPPENILKATDNFMSYNRNNRKITWHWQWKIIRDNIKKYTYL